MVDPNANGGNQGAQKSPLDVLEEILNESKKTGGVPGGAGAKLPGPSPEELALQEQQTQAAKIQQQQAQQAEAQVRDQQQLQQQLTDLQQAYQTPQYQEAVRQKTEKQQEEDQHKSDTEGYEIRQIEHTKIDVDQSTSN